MTKLTANQIKTAAAGTALPPFGLRAVLYYYYYYYTLFLLFLFFILLLSLVLIAERFLAHTQNQHLYTCRYLYKVIFFNVDTYNILFYGHQFLIFKKS